MLWSDLLGAFALYLVIEGILPFVNPAAMKRAMAAFLQLELRQLRIIGLLSMLSGLALLYFVRS
jgi:uncharacterized protein YjeT (DUF2065 family)